MSERSERFLNVVMSHFMTVLYVTFPAGGAAIAAYDVWHRGLASPPLQIGLGIVVIVTALKLMSYAIAVADVASESAGKVWSSAETALASWSRGLRGSFIHQRGRELSHA